MTTWESTRAGPILVRRVVLVGICLLIGPRATRAQALPFHTETAITAGFNENAARHFVSVLGRSGLVDDGRSLPDPMDRDVDALAVVNGVVLGAFTPLWTVSAVVPWVRKTMELGSDAGSRMRYETSGIGDALLRTKWVFYRNDRPGATTRLAIRGTVKVPTGGTDARLPSGPVAPRRLQVGTGTWDAESMLVFTNTDGRWGIHGNLGGRLGGRDDGFEAGDVLVYGAALAFRLLPATYESLQDRTVVGYLELNGDVAGHDAVDGTRDLDSGGHVLLISPGLQWIPEPWLLAEASLQVPVIQSLHGAQLSHETRLQVGIRYRFSVFR